MAEHLHLSNVVYQSEKHGFRQWSLHELPKDLQGHFLWFGGVGEELFFGTGFWF